MLIKLEKNVDLRIIIRVIVIIGFGGSFLQLVRVYMMGEIIINMKVEKVIFRRSIYIVIIGVDFEFVRVNVRVRRI